MANNKAFNEKDSLSIQVIYRSAPSDTENKWANFWFQINQEPFLPDLLFINEESMVDNFEKVTI